MPPSKSDNPAQSSAKSARLTRARRTAILKALADSRRFEFLERIAKAGVALTTPAAGAIVGSKHR